MTRRYYANNAPQLTLGSSITSSTTAFTVSGSFAGWPVTFPYYAVLDLGTGNDEIVSVTNVTSSTATMTRGQDGTVGVAHDAGATVDQCVIRQDFDEANAHVNATSGVHGVSGSLVGTSDAQTLTNKTLTAPALTAPVVTNGLVMGGGLVIGAPGGALTLTGSATVSGNVNAAKGNFTSPTSYTSAAAAVATKDVTSESGGASTNPVQQWRTLVSSTPTTVASIDELGDLVLAGAATVGGALAVTGAATVTGKLSPAGGYADDSGWVNLTIASGFAVANSATPQYRKRNGVVHFQGDVKPSSGSFAASTLYTIIAAGGVPTGFLPGTQSGAAKQIAGNSAAPDVKSYVALDGHIDINVGGSTTSYVSLSGLSGYIAEN